MTAMVWGVTGNVEKEIFYNSVLIENASKRWLRKDVCKPGLL